MAFCEGYNFIDICRYPTDYFPLLTEDDPPPTNQRNQCWVGMSNVDDFGLLPRPAGQACDTGCVSCRDLPDEIGTSLAPIDGTRWLKPDRERLCIDATGHRRPLIASQLFLIPRAPQYFLAAPCFDNLGTECFGGNVCACFGSRSGAKNIGPAGQPPDETRCIPTAGNRWLARGFFPSEFYYYGMEWPVRTSGFGGDATALGLYCRKFELQDPITGQQDGNLLVAMEGGEMLSPAWLRDMYRGPFPGHRCATNTMILCVSGVPDSDCSQAYANGWQYSDPPGTRPDYYNSAASRLGFARIAVSGTPYFRDLDNQFDGLSDKDKAAVAVKNEVLRAVTSLDLPTSTGSVRLDQLDHDFGYVPQATRPLNTWTRTWEPVSLPSDVFPVVSTFPIIGRFENAPENQTVDCDLVITKAEHRLWLMPVNIEQANFSGTDSLAIEYHARYYMRAWVTVRHNLDSQFWTLRQPWLPDDHPDRVVEITAVYADRLQPPTINRPDLTRLEYFTPDGVPVTVPEIVEWRGYLGQVGADGDRSRDHRFLYGGGGTSQVIYATRQGAKNLDIKGWPMAWGSFPDDPAQIHGGGIRIAFAA
jgi:hypothetical protein